MFELAERSVPAGLRASIGRKHRAAQGHSKVQRAGIVGDHDIRKAQNGSQLRQRRSGGQIHGMAIELR